MQILMGDEEKTQQFKGSPLVVTRNSAESDALKGDVSMLCGDQYFSHAHVNHAMLLQECSVALKQLEAPSDQSHGTNQTC